MANIVEIILKGQDRTGSAFKSAIQNLTGMNMAQLTVAAGAASLAVAVGAAFTSLVAHSIEAADAMGVMSQRAGESTETFSRLSYAAGLADVSQEDLVRASRAWAENAAKLGHGNESLADAIARVSGEFENTADSGTKLRYAYESFGKSGQNLIPLLNQGGQALRDAAEEADLFNITISREFARDADQFLDNIDRLKGAMRGLGNTIAEGVLPSLIKFTDTIIDSAKEVVKLSKAMEKVPEWVFWLSPVTAAVRLQALAWKQLRGEKEAAEADRDKKPIVDPEDLNKAVELWDKYNAQLTTGGERLKKDEQIRFEKELEHINRLAIEEGDKNDLLEFQKRVHEDNLTKMKAEGELARADIERFYRIGNEAEFQLSLRARQSDQLEWLQASQASMDLYRELWFNSLNNIGIAFKNFSTTAIRSFSDGFANAVASIATGAQSAKEAFEQLGKSMLGMLVKFAAQLVINSLLAAVLQKSIAASTLATIVPIATAWGVAAFLAAVATQGEALAAGALVAPLAAASGAASGAIALTAGSGGALHGGMDYVPAETTYLLQRGERVLSPNQNAELMDWVRGEGNGRVSVQQPVNFYFGDEKVGEALFQMSRDGRLTIHQRAIVA